MTIEARESPDSPDQEQGRDEAVETGAPAEAGPPDAESELRAELVAVNEEVDRLRRAAAEFDNLRKRAERERVESRWQTAARPLREFLGVVDDLDRALEAEASADDLRVGVELIRQKMTDLLRRFGVEPVESVNAPFDPNVHMAVAREDSPDVEEETVVEELQTGYTMESRLLREAMVRVAVPTASAASGGAVEQDVAVDADVADVAAGGS